MYQEGKSTLLSNAWSATCARRYSIWYGEASLSFSLGCCCRNDASPNLPVNLIFFFSQTCIVIFPAPDQTVPARHVGRWDKRPQPRQRVSARIRVTLLPPPLARTLHRGPPRTQAEQVQDQGQGHLSTSIVVDHVRRGRRIPAPSNTTNSHVHLGFRYQEQPHLQFQLHPFPQDIPLPERNRACWRQIPWISGRPQPSSAAPLFPLHPNPLSNRLHLYPVDNHILHRP